MKCRSCLVEMVEGLVMVPTVSEGVPDFPGGDAVTFSFDGPGRLVPCWKCPQCGHSRTGGRRCD